MKYANPKYLAGGLPGAPGSARNTGASGYPTRTGRAPGTTFPGRFQQRPAEGTVNYPNPAPPPGGGQVWTGGWAPGTAPWDQPGWGGGSVGPVMPIGTPAPPSGLPDTTPYPIGEDGQNIYPQPGDPDYTGPRPQPPGIMPIQPIGPWQPPPPGIYPPGEPRPPGYFPPGFQPQPRPQPPMMQPQPMPPRQYPPVYGGRPGWGARPWAPPQRQRYSYRPPPQTRYYPQNPGIRLGGGVLEQGQTQADPLQALLTKLQGGG